MGKIEKEYIVKPEEGIVVAFSYPEFTLESDCPLLGIVLTSMSYDEPDLDHYKGIARCGEHDKFSEETGRIIASAKADEKYHRAEAGRYARAAAKLRQAVDIAERKANSHKKKASRIDNMLKKY